MRFLVDVTDVQESDGVFRLSARVRGEGVGFNPPPLDIRKEDCTPAKDGAFTLTGFCHKSLEGADMIVSGMWHPDLGGSLLVTST